MTSPWLLVLAGGVTAGALLGVPGVSGVVVNLAETRPLFLAIDDAHWIAANRLEGDFPGGTFAMDFGAKQGDITCGGSVTTSRGTFTYFVTFTEVPPPRD